MTTKPRASKFRIRRSAPLAPEAAEKAPAPQPNAEPPAHANVDSPRAVAAETDLDAIRQEGLTGRQLRMARRVAQKHGLAVTSDFDAVRQLRQQGIDPFQRTNVLELVTPDAAQTDAAAQEMQAQGGGTPNQPGAPQLPAGNGQGRVQLPQTIVKRQQLPSTQVGPGPLGAEERASEIRKIQQDIARRRRRNLVSMFARLGMFVFLPTLILGYYFFVIATPMYATKSEFVVTQQQSQGSTGFGGLLQGTALGSNEDAAGTQSYLMSREAMLLLDEEHGFKAHFQQPHIDAIQRLDPDATNEDAYAIYRDRVIVGFDPTEGLIKMEVIAADPQTSQEFSEALLRYAEGRIDRLSLRAREDAMDGARQSYEEAEQRRQDALAELTRVQSELETTNVEGPNAALQQRITNLELQLDDKMLELATLEAARRPNEALMNVLQAQMDRIQEQIDQLRSQVSQGNNGGFSITEISARLRQAEENYAFQTVLVQQALTAMETSRVEAERQRIYLETNVAPVAPDQPTYPRAFENTVLSFLVFAGIYLMFSLTASILREQVSS